LGMTLYAQWCGWTLAHAHARSGDPVAIAEYVGAGDGFDRAITTFSARYADQNSRDHDTFLKAVSDGRIDAIEGV
jgi:predicted alpha/beta hydrolase